MNTINIYKSNNVIHYGTIPQSKEWQMEVAMQSKPLPKKDFYVIVTWPESQDFIGKHNCHLINDNEGLVKYGSSAYFVRVDMYERVMFNKLNPPISHDKKRIS